MFRKSLETKTLLYGYDNSGLLSDGLHNVSISFLESVFLILWIFCKNAIISSNLADGASQICRCAPRFPAASRRIDVATPSIKFSLCALTPSTLLDSGMPYATYVINKSLANRQNEADSLGEWFLHSSWLSHRDLIGCSHTFQSRRGLQTAKGFCFPNTYSFV